MCGFSDMDKMKRLINLGFLMLLLVVLLAVPALAASVTNATYIGDIVIENSGTAIEAPSSAVVSINTSAVIEGKFVNSDLLNTAIQLAGGTDVPYMPGVDTNPWVLYSGALAANEQKSMFFYVGGPDMQTGFNYFPDSGGMTTPDNDVSLKLDDDFEIEQKVWVDTSAGDNKNLVYKEDAFQTYVSDSSEISSVILDTSTMSPYSSTSDGDFAEQSNVSYATARDAVTSTPDDTSADLTIGQNFAGGWYSIYRAALYFDTSAIPDDAVITSATLKLYGSNDNSTTDFNITIQNGQPTNPEDPLANTDYNRTLYSGDGGSLTTVGFSVVAYNNIPLNGTGLTWVNKEGTTKLFIRSSRDIGNNAPAGTELVGVYSTNQAGTAKDPQLVVNYSYSAASVTATGITSGLRKVVTTADGTNLTISVYDENDVLIDDDIVALGGVSVPNNDNPWNFLTNGSIVYMDYHKITINGELRQHIIYERDTTFHDQTEYNNDATPTFRTTSSDPDLTATFSNFRPIKQNEASISGMEDIPAMLDESEATMPPEMYTEMDTEHLPGASLVNELLGVGGIPLDLFWIPAVFGLAALAVLFAYRFAKSMLIISIIGLCIIIFFSLTGVVPFWTVIIYIVMTGGLCVAEKNLSW